MEDKGTLIIYIDENNEFIIERLTPSNDSFKKAYSTEDGLREGLKSYRPIIYQMDLRIQQNAKMKNGTSLMERVTDILFDRENK